MGGKKNESEKYLSSGIPNRKWSSLKLTLI